MDRDPFEWREQGRGRVNEMLSEMHKISAVRAAARHSDPGKCSECGYELGNLSFPATCDYCGSTTTPEI